MNKMQPNKLQITNPNLNEPILWKEIGDEEGAQLRGGAQDSGHDKPGETKHWNRIWWYYVGGVKETVIT